MIFCVWICVYLSLMAFSCKSITGCKAHKKVSIIYCTVLVEKNDIYAKINSCSWLGCCKTWDDSFCKALFIKSTFAHLYILPYRKISHNALGTFNSISYVHIVAWNLVCKCAWINYFLIIIHLNLNESSYYYVCKMTIQWFPLHHLNGWSFGILIWTDGSIQ